jgi:hypothetical protein
MSKPAVVSRWRQDPSVPLFQQVSSLKGVPWTCTAEETADGAASAADPADRTVGHPGQPN